MNVTLEAIKFNHDPMSATTDAFNIRKNETEMVPVPEWQRGITINPEDSVAAYAISETSGNTITIQAKFKCAEPNIKTVEIRALDPARNSILSEVEDVIDSVLSLFPFPGTGNKNVLGRVKRKQVTFRESGETDFETFELADVRTWSAGVSVSTIMWQWQYRLKPADPWTNVATSSHRIYTVLKMPGPPWLQDPFEETNSQLPWAEVLNYACEWAHGARTLEEAATRITYGLRSFEKTMYITYSPSCFYSDPNFDCTSFLDLLNNGEGQGSKLNCRDCATVTSTFANVLGCALWQASIGGPRAFFTNPIRLFGRTCWMPTTFGSHEVAWTGACTENDQVFDACLEVDADQDPVTWPHKPLLPTNMRFGTRNEQQYLFRMVAAHQPEGMPHPIENSRTRRPIRPNPKARVRLLPGELRRPLKSHYDYDAWRHTISAAEKLFIANFSLRPADFLDWKFIGQPQIIVTSNRPRIIQTLFKVLADDTSQLMRLDIDVCRSEPAARCFLLQRLGQFDAPTLKWRKKIGFGDVTFTEPEEGSVLFARANLVVLLRNAGHDAVEITQLARHFDFQVSSKPEGDKIGEMHNFFIPEGKFFVGQPVPLESLPTSSIRMDQPFKFFTTGGYVRLRKGRLAYVSSNAGAQEITIFAIDSYGNILRQRLSLTVIESA